MYSTKKYSIVVLQEGEQTMECLKVILLEENCFITTSVSGYFSDSKVAEMSEI